MNLHQKSNKTTKKKKKSNSRSRRQIIFIRRIQIIRGIGRRTRIIIIIRRIMITILRMIRILRNKQNQNTYEEEHKEEEQS